MNIVDAYIYLADKAIEDVEKEKKSMYKWSIGDVLKTEEYGDCFADYVITDIDWAQCINEPKCFKVEIVYRPKRKPYTGKIFIRCGRECNVLKSNKIYNVSNGCIVNNAGDRMASCIKPYIFEDMSDDELSKAIDNNIFYGVHYSGDKDRRYYTAYFIKE